MKFSKILLSSIVLSASIGSAFACELEDGYKLPEDIEFGYYCEFEDGLSVVYKDNEDSEKVRYGYVDKKGKLVIPTVYNEAYAFAEGFGLVKKGDKTYFIKPDGKIAFDVSNNDENHAFSEGYAVAKKNGKWGYLAPTGKFAIEPQYDDAFGFSEGLASVAKDGKYGFIDKNNKVVIPFDYEETAKWFYDDKIIPAKKNGKYGMIDTKNKTIVPFIYDYAEYFEGDLAIVGKITGQDENDNDIYKYGFVNKNGKVVIPLKYDDADTFEDGKAEVAIGDDYFYINKQGKKVDD